MAQKGSGRRSCCISLRASGMRGRPRRTGIPTHWRNGRQKSPGRKRNWRCRRMQATSADAFGIIFSEVRKPQYYLDPRTVWESVNLGGSAEKFVEHYKDNRASIGRIIVSEIG